MCYLMSVVYTDHFYILNVKKPKQVTTEQSGQVEDQGMFLNKLLDLVDK